ncbi:MAG: hypothetical protein M1480_19070 [Bacteroidetes bacterium]|nr:hypothetical protein [Bacteroidota bacterium]
MDEDKNKNESYAEKRARERKEWAEKFKRLESEFLSDLKTNPRYSSFFEPYKKSSVDSFIESYAHHKARLLVYSDYCLSNEEDYITKYYNKAEEIIWDIQQRKLYDLQIKWRAEQIKIPEVEISYEFLYWERHIKSCPFISPISQDEFDLYMAYLNYSSYNDIFYWDFNSKGYQDYEDFKKQYFYLDKHEEYYTDPPPWYEFYESRTGLGVLYLLPDLRGTKEDFYIDIYIENKRKIEEEKNKDKPKAEVKYEHKESIPWDYGFIEEFIRKFEDEDTYRKYIGYRRIVEMEDDDLADAIETLHYADRIMPIGNNKNWKDGIIEAAHNYEKIKLIEEMPKVYADYRFRVNAGIKFEGDDRALRKKYLDGVVDHFKHEILEGRMLNGEPADFNF